MDAVEAHTTTARPAAVIPAGTGNGLPLTEAQRGVWLAQQVEPSTGVYNIGEYLELRGTVDVELLRRAIRTAVAECDVLRTTVRVRGEEPEQVVAPDGEVELELVDLSGEAAPVEAAEEWMRHRIWAPEHQGARSLKGFVLIRVGPEHALFFLHGSHLVIDAFGAALVAVRISQVYTELAWGAEVSAGWFGRVADLVAADTGYRESDDRERDAAFWHERLAERPEAVTLSGHPVRVAPRGRVLRREFAEEDAAGIVALSEQLGVSTSTVLLTHVALLLWKTTGRYDLPIGLPVGARVDPALKLIPGMMSNILPVRLAGRPGEDFASLAAGMSATVRASMKHQRYRYEWLIRDSRHLHGRPDPLFGVEVNIMNFNADLRLGDMAAEFRTISTGPVHDVTLNLRIDAQRPSLGVEIEADAERHSAADLEGLADRLASLLRQVREAGPTVRAADLSVLSDAEREGLAAEYGGTAHPVAATTLPELFAEQARARPDAVAVVADGRGTTYAALDALTGTLAGRLRAEGVGPERFVALCLPRSPALVAGALAVTRAGGAYVPVDPEYPRERVAHTLTDAAPLVVLTTEGLRPLVESAVAAGTRVLVLGEDGVLADGTGGQGTQGTVEAQGPVGTQGTPHRVAGPAHPAYMIYTSGSTGRPKGVVVTHSALVNRLLWMQSAYGLTGVDRVLQKTPASFDVSVWELFWPLVTGATLVLAAPGGHRDPAYLASVIGAERVTVVHFVPSMLEEFVREGLARSCGSLRLVMCSGEALTPVLRDALLDQLDVDLRNLYGPTEATVDVTASGRLRRTGSADPVPIGRPVWNTRLYVLDEALSPVPEGVAGELYLAGDQLARGYHRRAALTAERFVADPFGPAGTRMYRTGDLVRRREDGTLLYVGRADDQVKIRGVRVEPGEVRAALLAHPGIGSAAVVARPDNDGTHRLIAYVVPAAGHEVTEAELRADTARLLPGPLVPSRVVCVDALPLTPSGKLDTHALPAPASAPDGPSREPRDDRERLLCALFAEVLGVESVGVDASFFDLGGHSLSATRLGSRVRASLGLEVPVRAVFDAPTPAALAVWLDEHGRTARPALTRAERPDPMPLSPAQSSLWFLYQLEGPSPTYNIPLLLTLSGSVDRVALRRAFQDIADRHETLRTVVGVDSSGLPHQRVLPPGQVPVEWRECRVEAGALAGELETAAHHRFDLSAAPPLRVTLFETGPDACTVLILLHHIAADGWSFSPLADDLFRAYTARAEGAAPEWEPLPVQYADHTLWQRALLGDRDAADAPGNRQLTYWKERLAGLPDVVTLPADRPRPAVSSYRGATVDFAFDADLAGRIAALAEAHGATVFMVLQASLAALLTRLGAGTDIPLGSPVAGRTDTAVDRLIGCFVNPLVLRVDTSGDPAFGDLLDRVRQDSLAAYAHQDVPFERVVEALRPHRSAGHHPLFQVSLALQNMAYPRTALPGLEASGRPLYIGVSRFDLSLSLVEHFADDGAPAGLSGVAEYATDLYDRATVEALVARWARLLEQFTADPRLGVGGAVLDAGTARRPAAGDTPAGPAVLGGARTLPELFERRAAASPDAVALSAGAERIVYRELNARANRLSHRLIGLGIGPEDTVAIALPRSAELVTVALAVAKAGAAFLPLDPSYPAERIAYMLGDASPALTVTASAHAEGPVAGHGPVLVLDAEGSGEAGTGVPGGTDRDPVDTDRVRPLLPEHPAYVIYTSGSTGAPKGVVVTHTGLAGLTADMAARFGIDASARVLQFASPSFDASVMELLMALPNGATLVVPPEGTVLAGDTLAAFLAEQDVSLALIPPTVLAGVRPEAVPGLRTLLVGGEACPAERVARWRQGRRMLNAYGPTEATICATTSGDLTGAGTPPIGTPVAGTRAYVLDAALRTVPHGVVGELYLAGPGLARGYLGRPALTSSRFVADPYGEPGARMYRTGDLARVDPDGDLVYEGRADGQLKLRGFRIEAGEVETALLDRPGVGQAVVIVREDRPGDVRLTGYVVQDDSPQAPGEESGPSREALPELLREALRDRLPAYMVPSAVVVLDALPVTANGKLDRAALPAPETVTGVAGRGPRTVREELLAGLFADVLGLPSVGVDDDFFALGGHSLLATRLISRIRRTLGSEVAIRDLFAAPTVAGLAERIEKASATARPAIERRDRPAHLPLSYAQQRLWFLNRLEGGSATYNMPLALRLRGEVDGEALRAAWTDVLTRHETLRTMFGEHEGNPVQVILDPEVAADRILSTEHLTPGTDAEAWTQEITTRGFDLTKDLPVRVVHGVLSDTESMLVVVLHHIAGDGWSLAPLAHDLSAAYGERLAGRTPTWDELPVQYADYTLWQRDHLGTTDNPDSLLTAQTNHWRTTLAGAPAELPLPFDRPRPAHPTHAGATVAFRIPQERYDAVSRLAKQHGVTVFMVLQAATAITLNAFGAGTDIPLGTPVAGRTDETLKDLVGFFVNTLVLRTDLSDNPTFHDTLTRVRDTNLAAYENQDIPFEAVVEALNPARSTHHHPLFQVMVDLQNNTTPELHLAGLDITVDGTGVDAAKFDLQFSFAEELVRSGDTAGPEGLSALLYYATDLFDAATAERLADGFLRVLDTVTVAPDTSLTAIDVLTSAERSRLLDAYNATGHATSDALLPELLTARAARTPERPALVCEGAEVSYGELDARSDRLARYLIAQGAGPETLVAVALPRGPELVTALLAVLKAGAAYLPVDPGRPSAGIARLLADAAPALLLTDPGTRTGLPVAGVPVHTPGPADLAAFPATAVSDADRVAPLRPQHPAYVIHTSGSTGTPKGITMPGAAVVNLLRWHAAEFGGQEGGVQGAHDGRRTAQFTGISFDVSVQEILTTLVTGATLHIPGEDIRRDPEAFAAWLAEHRVTDLFVPNLMVDALSAAAVEHGHDLSSLRHIMQAGERLHLSLPVREFFRRETNARLHNHYGPAETHVVTARSLPPAESDWPAEAPVGRPVWNTRAYVLDDALRPAPPGVTGELYIAGAQLARGYLNRPALTATRFLPDPYGAPGTRMYRTGDLAHWNADGDLVYVGRSDDQVKIRGFRVEPAEIEAVLLTHPAVGQAAVVPREDVPGDTRLIAYVTVSDSAPGGLAAELRALAGGLLPDYMVPSAVVVLDVLPVTVNGKLDRRALPAPDAVTGTSGRAPRSLREELLAGLFAEVLGVPSVGVDDDFFALGGHSLLATRLISRIRRTLGSEVAIRDLFTAPTVAALADRMDGATGVVRPALARHDRPAHLPLSYAQQRLWFLNRLEGGSGTYNLPLALRLRGEVDGEALRAAWTDVLTRHETLRTVFGEHEGNPVQVILDPEVAADRILSTEHLTPGTDTQAWTQEITTRGFDLTKDLPVRVVHGVLSDTESMLVVVLHHIAGDGWSLAPLAHDLSAAYGERLAGRTPTWDELPVQYADYTLWQRDHLGTTDNPDSLLTAQTNHWRTTLAGAPAELPLPLDRPRPTRRTYEGAVVNFQIGTELSAKTTELASRTGVTTFMVLQAATAITLNAFGAGTDIPLGTPVAGRTDETLKDLVGFFVNTLVLRTDLSDNPTFQETLTRVRDTNLAAYENQDIPFEAVVEALNPARSTHHHPLFQVMVDLRNDGELDLDLPKLEIETVPLRTEIARFDLQFSFAERFTSTDTGRDRYGLAVGLHYATDLFDAETAERMAQGFLRILETVTTDPGTPLSQIDALTPEDRTRLLHTHNNTTHPVPPPLVPDLFTNQATHTPHHPALTFDNKNTSYGELDARSNQLARHLITHGAAPETRIAVALPRGPQLLTTLLAILKTGAAYLPIDPTNPPARTTYVLEDATPGLLLTDTATRAVLPVTTVPVHTTDTADLSAYPTTPVTDADRLTPLLPQHPAYAIYTSGSTGTPKGTLITHAALVNRLCWMQDTYGLSVRDRVLQKTPVTFDVSVWELFWPLITGATLTIARPEGHKDPAYLSRLITTTGTTVVHFVPSMLQAFLDHPQTTDDTPLRLLITSGEALSPDLAERCLTRLPGVRLHNLYGPTEATIDVTATHALTPADTRPVPIGHPVWNTRAYVLDDALRPVPPGVTGELYIAGAQLARGYLNRPALTATRFLPDPYGAPGTRMYRTGDLAHWNTNGDLVYVGRSDDQVKIRGFRVEPAEIETVLLTHPTVRQAAVIPRQDVPGDTRLVAYVTTQDTTDAHLPSELRMLAARSLPDHMVPSAFVPLDVLPVTANGKLDRRALPAPGSPAGNPGREPRTAREEVLCDLFADVLGLPAVGVDDDFFALGGHSLLVIRLIGRIREALGVEPAIRDLFTAPTVSALAVLLDTATGPARPVLTRRERPERLPVSYAQQRLWFLNRLEGGSGTYNMPLALRLTGTVDARALRDAWADVLTRHETLRTMFGEHEGNPVQVILDPQTAADRILSTEHLTPGTDTQAWTQEITTRGFDLTEDVPVRVVHGILNDTESVLVVVLHHIAGDGWSLAPLAHDLSAAYGERLAGRTPTWDELPVQYADYTLWQRDHLGTTNDPDSLLTAQTNHWRTTLAGAPAELPLPHDRPRPAQPTHQGATVGFRLDGDLGGAVSALAAAHGVTVFMVLQAATAITLNAFGAGTDIPLGTPVAGRTDETLKDLVGFFVNTLVLRTDLSDNPTFQETLVRVRDTNLAAYENQDIPFEAVVEALNPARSTHHHPLFQVMVDLQNNTTPELHLAGLDITVDGTGVDAAKFDLQFSFTEDAEGMSEAGGTGGFAGALTYATDLFDAATARRMTDGLLCVLRTVTADPDTPLTGIGVLSAADRGLLLEEYNTAVRPSAAPFPAELFAERALRDPDRAALLFEGSEVSYGELDARANRLARYLIAHGAGPETLVAVALPRGPELVTALLAVLKAGAAYLPLDPTSPPARLAYTLSDAVPALLLTDPAAASAVREGLPGTDVPVHAPDPAALAGYPATPVTDTDRIAPPRPEHPAYVLYTSGSTGTPKGTVVPRGAVGTFVADIASAYAVDAGTRLLGFAAVTFDVSVFEIFTALATGATLVLAGEEQRTDADLLQRLLREARVTVAELPPAVLPLLDPATLPELRLVSVGGEAPAGRLVDAWATADREFWNGYGPTETTVAVTLMRCAPPAGDRTPPIGRPTAHTRAYVLDAALRPVPPGVTGELYVAGAQLARGYLNRPALTGSRFVADPYGAPGTRMYRTGDLARWNADGDLVFMGRTDDQVKIRGFRVEPAEIETALLTHPAVGQAAVVARADGPDGGTRLLAYVTRRQPAPTEPVPSDPAPTEPTGPAPAGPAPLQGSGEDAGHSAAELRSTELATALSALATRLLPPYMVPSAVVVVDGLPVTANGKLDTAALPVPAPEPVRPYRAPRTPREDVLCGLFAEVLGAARIGVDDSFFDLGGHSLLATRLISRVRTTLGVELPLRTLFESPTPATLAARLDAQPQRRPRPALRPRNRQEDNR
ncbi:non-ribosomal peptide synthase/polyketide synthase [Streptomyces sp. P6-2-1]|uniref:non-ribosomal peptide synthetase n=1 Tax=Streptomyces sp. P6-2-1 TaxID=3422591 RepID=UPI003D3678DB